ncbi:hypothetical protein LMG27177_06666 [Paraburkholderia fynbosensis]|uniref:Uncharacterized protein n=2 Tax=Paraburkholderia fynbosensis TaxID=1200993 RepID=A0A6J5GZ67_9BURK|nr:hypothetical protein LMG27177_06666 [Paraburkholderia fynbosensis]
MTQVGAFLFCSSSVRAQTGGCGKLCGTYTTGALLLFGASEGGPARMKFAVDPTASFASGAGRHLAGHAQARFVERDGAHHWPFAGDQQL